MEEILKNTKEIWRNIWKIYDEIYTPYDLAKFRAFQQEGGESFAGANIIPEMAPSKGRRVTRQKNACLKFEDGPAPIQKFYNSLC